MAKTLQTTAILRSLLLPGAMLVAESALSQHDYLTEEDVYGEIPAVSIASRIPQSPDKVPASVTVIDRELIEASGALSWVELFRLVPGFQAYYVNGNHYGISYHGIGRGFPNHLEAMIDGRSAYDPAFSTVGWGALGLSLEDVDHIEIVRGSSAPAHGSNAFLGAVNIVTRTPVQDSGTRLTTTWGDRDTREAFLSNNGQLGDLTYRASISYRSNDGFPAVTDDPDGDNGPLDDGTEEISTRLRGTYTPNLTDIIDVQAGFTHARPGWGDVDHPDEYTRAIFDTHYESLKWQRSLPSGNELQLHFYHNRLKGENNVALGLVSELLNLPPAVFPIVVSGVSIEDQTVFTGFRNIETERYDIELEHRLQLSQSLRATWGAAYRHETAEATQLFSDNEKRHLHSRRLFGHAEWSASPKWTLNGGVMIEDNNLVDTIFSSRLGINYHLSPQHTLRASIARGRRSPSLVEAYEFNADFLEELLVQAIRRTVGELEEERLTSYELGYIGHFPRQRLTLDIHLFKEQIREGYEVFDAPPDPGTPVFNPNDNFATRANNLSMNISGVELQLRYRPTPETLLAAQYSYRHVDSDYVSLDDGIDFRTRNHNSRAPRHTANLVVSQQLTDGLAASINIHHASAADWRDGNAVDEFTRVDARLKYGFRVGRSRCSLSLIGQNLGEDYSEHGQNNVFDTRVYLKFEAELP